jgi:hypothetical protein
VQAAAVLGQRVSLDALRHLMDRQAYGCARPERYTVREPLPGSDFLIARGRALARFGCGERGTALRASVAGLREEAARAELNVVLPALHAELEAMESAPTDRP